MIKKTENSTQHQMIHEPSGAPPGQYVTKKFPVMTFGPTPSVNTEKWQFKVFGLVEKSLTLNWEQFTSISNSIVTADFHCVTQWSRTNNTWEGILFNDLMQLVKPNPEACFVMVHCHGGYSTNLSLKVLQDHDVLFARKHDGAPIQNIHGGPLRLVVPKRYGWKSAKWVNGLEFMAIDTPGFWETQGYHMEGDPLNEQRFQDNYS